LFFSCLSPEEYLLLCGSRPGLIMNPMTNRTEEIDECTLMPNMCNHGSCVNTPGSFHCSCDGGYVYDANSHQCIGAIAALYYCANGEGFRETLNRTFLNFRFRRQRMSANSGSVQGHLTVRQHSRFVRVSVSRRVQARVDCQRVCG